jgi:hypothetical protein
MEDVTCRAGPPSVGRRSSSATLAYGPTLVSKIRQNGSLRRQRGLAHEQVSMVDQAAEHGGPGKRLPSCQSVLA